MRYAADCECGLKIWLKNGKWIDSEGYERDDQHFHEPITPPWTSSTEVNRALTARSEKLADGEQSERNYEAEYAKEVMLHAVTKFELKKAGDLLQEFTHAANYLQSWIEHTVPTWTPEVQRGLEELRGACDKAGTMPSCQPLPDKQA